MTNCRLSRRRGHNTMCLCWPPWCCGACFGWRGVNSIGPPLDTEAIARRRERRARSGLCWSAKPVSQTMETRTGGGGTVEMVGDATATASGDVSVVCGSTASIESTHGKDTSVAPRDGNHHRTSVRGIRDKGKLTVTIPDVDPAGDENMSPFAPLKPGVFDSRDPRSPNAPPRYGMGPHTIEKLKQPKRSAPARAATSRV